MNKSCLLCIYLCLTCFLTNCNAQSVSNTGLTKDQIKRISSFVETAMNKTGVVPGLGLAVVVGDQVAYAGGFGYRDVENKLPVTAETGFYIASKTKSFVAMTTACLEHKGLFSLHEPLSHFYPGKAFELPLHADSINLIKLLSHNHQISNGGLQFRLAFIDDVTSETFSRILFDISSQGRPGFRYSNIGYNIIGNILEQQGGKSWQELVEEEVLKPAGLHGTTAYMSKALKRPFAYPYFKESGTFKRLVTKVDGQMQSAGGMVSTPKDLANWIILNMHSGQLNGRQVLPKNVLQRIHQPYAVLDRNFFKFHRKAYELGWYQSDYEGDELTHHFGSYEGYMTHVSYMPQHQIGVVALSNELETGGRLPHLVAAFIYDLLLGKEHLEEKYEAALQDWEASVNERSERILPQVKQKNELLAEAKTNPGGWKYEPADFTGSFFNPRLGHFEVSIEKDGQLWSTFGVHHAPLLPIAKDQFLVDWNMMGYTDPPIRLTTHYDESDNVVAMYWDLREFRRLTKGIEITATNQIYAEVRGAIKAIIKLPKNKQASAVNTILEKHYPTGLLNEMIINALGYKYLRMEELTVAIALFQFNVDRYPTSSNTYDSLGEAYLTIDDKFQAKANYAKALELDPENNRIKEILESLM